MKAAEAEAFSQHSHLVTSLSVARRRHISAVLLVRRLLLRAAFLVPGKVIKNPRLLLTWRSKATTVCVCAFARR